MPRHPTHGDEELDVRQPPSKAARDLGHEHRHQDSLAHDELCNFVNSFGGEKSFASRVGVKRSVISKYMNRSALWPRSRLAHWGRALELDEGQRDALQILVDLTLIHQELLSVINVKCVVTKQRPLLRGPRWRERQREMRENRLAADE